MSAGKRILVVDDERSIADSLAMIFFIQGYECKAAHTAEEAIEIVSAWLPDLAIVDVQLSETYGVTLALTLHRQCPDCKISLFTGLHDVAPLLEEGRKAGYDFEIIPKPIHPAEMLKLVAGFLAPASGPEPA